MSEGADHTYSHRLRQLALFLLCAGFSAFSYAEQPRLVLLIVVDQLPYRFYNSSSTFTDGLKTLREQGAFFTNARYRQVPTETEAGHASIVTGRPPSETGVINNELFDRHKQKVTNILWDETTDTHNARAILRAGISDILKGRNDRTVVISLSGKSSSAILMGGMKPDIVGWYTFWKRRFSSSPFYKPLPAWLARMTADGILPSGETDSVVAKAAMRAIEKLNAGKDDVPDFVAVSFSAPDQIGHRVGPDSDRYRKTLLDLDKTIGELLRFCEKEVGADHFVAVLTSDHGAVSMPESSQGKNADIKRLNKKQLKNRIEAALKKTFPGPGPFLLHFSLPHLYLDRTRISSMDDAAKAIRVVDGVAAVYRPPFNEKDPYVDVYRNSYFRGRSGDLMIRLEENRLPLFLWEGTGHGGPYECDTHVPLVFYGAPFKRGTYAVETSPLSIVPTLGLLLDFSLTTSPEGKPLKEALRK